MKRTTQPKTTQLPSESLAVLDLAATHFGKERSVVKNSTPPRTALPLILRRAKYDPRWAKLFTSAAEE